VTFGLGVQACTSLNESSNIQTGAPPTLAPAPPKAITTKVVILQVQANTRCLRYGTEILNRGMYFGITRGIRLSMLFSLILNFLWERKNPNSLSSSEYKAKQNRAFCQQWE